MVAPTPNGRNSNGRFSTGNSGGPGNPHAMKVGQLRSALIDAVSPEDIAAIVGKLVEQAKAGDVRAIREVLDRTLGKPVEADLIERLEHGQINTDQSTIGEARQELGDRWAVAERATHEDDGVVGRGIGLLPPDSSFERWGDGHVVPDVGASEPLRHQVPSQQVSSRGSHLRKAEPSRNECPRHVVPASPGDAYERSMRLLRTFLASKYS